MRDLTPEEVEILAQVSGVRLLAQDMVSVTRVLNALRRSLASLEVLPVAGVETEPAPDDGEETS